MPVAEAETVVQESATELAHELRQFEDASGLSTMQMVVRLKHDPDSLDYENVDINRWYCSYLAFLEVNAADEPETHSGAPPDPHLYGKVKEGSSEPFFYTCSVARLRYVPSAGAGSARYGSRTCRHL
jgi:hypothetical protein